MTLSGNPADYLVAFLGGILMSFSPCIYPLIPVSASYIGVSSSSSRSRAFILAFVYASGFALTYSAFGIFASLTGTLLGRFSEHPAIYFSFGILMIVFGLSMLEIVRLPDLPVLRLPALKEKSLLGALLLGIGSALLISPCTSPVLGSILLYLAQRKNILYGATLLLSFAYGMSLILLLSGLFANFLLNLPKAGRWTLYIRRIFAFLLLVSGAYIIYEGINRL
ncbi:MAG: hypothetical protein FJZ09_07255 [Candidatus Omnitrophica bacterium]|nr:hypothetical protein [Candidatus Omnitrophota bacterium]